MSDVLTGADSSLCSNLIKRFEEAVQRSDEVGASTDAGACRRYRGRLAPTPSGYLHLGHAQTFWIAYQRALTNGGDLVLRIEDLDAPRCKLPYYQEMIDDMLWFGIQWDYGPTQIEVVGGKPTEVVPPPTGRYLTGPAPSFPSLSMHLDPGPYLQSSRRDLYLHAWMRLYEAGCIYPSNHSRKEIEAISAPHEGEGDTLFPICLRPLMDTVERDLKSPGRSSWRFRVPDGEHIQFRDERMGDCAFTAGVDFGDFLIWRFDGFPSYEMAVVVDDLAMGVTEIVRGEDLLVSTARQLLVYRALGSKFVPRFYHTPLVRDENGKRLAKRDGARSIRALKESGYTPEAIRSTLCNCDLSMI